MKAFTIACTLSMSVFFFACGSSTNDTVSEADSINEAKMDTTEAQGTSGPISEEDSRFAVEAANGGMMEVELGNIAQEKGTNSKVKEFGAMMVKDHTKANEELKALAAQKNIALPAAPGEEARKTITDISAKSGTDFDKAYIDEMVKDHEKDVKLFEEAQQDVKDADMRAFIDKTLPVLRMHLDHVKSLNK